MRLFTVTILLAGALAAPAFSADLLVVGRHEVFFGPDPVNARAQRVPVAGKGRCVVAARTPLAALLDSRLELTVEDYGSCGRRASDSAGLYVRGIGGDRAAKRGRNGWKFKVGNRALSSGAADLASRTRGKVLWFWCRDGKSGCQRTLAVKVGRKRAATGSTLAVRVRAYDDDGRFVPAKGAKVRIGSSGATARADAKGIARVELGDQAGTFSVYATQPGRVRSFSAAVRIK